MRFLLDTNAVLWVQANAPRIDSIRNLLLADENDVFISTVSWWEIAIKVRIGKLSANVRAMRLNAKEKGFMELPLEGTHTEVLEILPRYHNDPFDHMLLAQAIAEPMRFITGDRILAKYTPLVLSI